jgi:hypothetical protein
MFVVAEAVRAIQQSATPAAAAHHIQNTNQVLSLDSQEQHLSTKVCIITAIITSHGDYARVYEPDQLSKRTRVYGDPVIYACVSA